MVISCFAAPFRRQSQATRPVVSHHDEPNVQVITNLLSDNPSRNITASCSKRRRSAERINRNLSRDPQWTAHSAANTTTRTDSPSSSNSSKGLSAQRQIFWPNTPEQTPRRHVCSKKKHIGKLSSLVYCSYPPNRLVYSQGESKRKEPAANRPSNGDILAMMFHRPSSSSSTRPGQTNEHPSTSGSLVSTIDTPTTNRDDKQSMADKPSTSLGVTHTEHRKGRKRKHDSVDDDTKEKQNNDQNEFREPPSKRMRKSGGSRRHDPRNNRMYGFRFSIRERIAQASRRRRKQRNLEKDLNQTQDLRRYAQIRMAVKRKREQMKEEGENSDEENPAKRRKL